MHPTESALLAAVIANPADDLRRLIYADWLDENGEGERAEFIRVQCRIADVDRHRVAGKRIRGGWKRVRAELMKREDELFGGDVGRWFHAFGWGSRQVRCDQHHYHALKSTFAIRRGFIADVECTLKDWLTHGPAVVRSHPVTSVTLTDVRPHRHIGAQGERFGFELRDENARDDWQLPACIFSELPPGDWVINRNRRWWGAVEEAESHLSAACIRWAIKERDRNGSQADESRRQQVSQAHGG